MKDIKNEFIEYYNKINMVGVVESNDDDLELVDEEDFWQSVDNMIDEIYEDE